MIRKAVILAAGLGSRFLPITRVVPKPMLPIGNKPVLDYIIDELQASGITQILIVVGHRREIIENYYRGRSEIQFTVQNPLNGTAPAVLLAESFTAGEPFALCLSDEIVEAKVACIQQLAAVFLRHKASLVMAIEQTTEDKIRMYNSVGMNEIKGNECKLISIVEKPQEGYTSLFTAIGRYIISPVIFAKIKALPIIGQQELYLTDAFNLIMKEGRAYGLRYEGKRWDTGTKEGWIETNVRLGLK